MIRNGFLGALLWLSLTPLLGAQPTEAPEATPLTPERIQALDALTWQTLTFGAPPEPISIARAKVAIEGRTTIALSSEQQWVDFADPLALQTPFLHLEMCGPPPANRLEDKLRWRDFFNHGGTLFLDVCTDVEDSSSEAWKSWARVLYPQSSWAPLNRQHTLSFSFYLLEKRMLLGPGGTPIHLLEEGGRPIMILNDSAKWSWSRLRDSPVRVTGNAADDEVRLRLYVNLLMLVLSGDYKSDQLHLPTILLRRR